MSRMEVDQVLAQIRSIRAQIAAPELGASRAPGGIGPAALPGAPSFATLMKQGIDQVNAIQQSASAKADAFERGVPGVELSQVMLEMQKASVSFRAVTEVRNRLVNAYQEIMNMPV